MFRHALRLAALGGLATLALAPSAQAAPKPATCHTESGHAGKHYCLFYPAGNGLTSGTKVLNSAGGRVGYLHQGENWVICERVGIEAYSGNYHNHWWAWTEADNRKWGWVNALYAHGGANDGAFSGTPGCGSAHGLPPHVTPPPPVHKPPPPKPTGPSRATLRARANKIMKLSYKAFVAYKHAHHPAPFDWSSDGCTDTPQPFASLFNGPCQLHDFGYRNYGHGKLHLGENEGERAYIDSRLRHESKEVCNANFGGFLKTPVREGCYQAADVMWGVVRNLGRTSFYH